MKNYARMHLYIIYIMTFDKDLFRELTATLRGVIREDKPLVEKWDELFSKVNRDNFSDVANGIVLFNVSRNKVFFEGCVLVLIASSLSPEPFTNKFFENGMTIPTDVYGLGPSITNKYSVLYNVMNGWPSSSGEIDEVILSNDKVGINVYVVGSLRKECFVFKNGCVKHLDPLDFV